MRCCWRCIVLCWGSPDGWGCCVLGLGGGWGGRVGELVGASLVKGMKVAGSDDGCPSTVKETVTRGRWRGPAVVLDLTINAWSRASR